MRFSPRFLKVFLGLPAAFFSGVPPSAASVFAIPQSSVSVIGRQSRASIQSGTTGGLATGDWRLNRLLLRNRTLARPLAGAGVGAGALAVHRQPAAMTHAAIASDFHQSLDVHRDLLAEIAFHAPLLFDHAADLAHVVFGQILDAKVAADAGFLKDQVRADPPDAEDVSETDFNPLGARKIDACYTCHSYLNLEFDTLTI